MSELFKLLLEEYEAGDRDEPDIYNFRIGGLVDHYGRTNPDLIREGISNLDDGLFNPTAGGLLQDIVFLIQDIVKTEVLASDEWRRLCYWHETGRHEADNENRQVQDLMQGAADNYKAYRGE